MDLNNKELIEEVLDSPTFNFFERLKLSNMPRAQRRRKEKELEKMKRAVRTFTPEQIDFIDKLIVQVCNQELNEFAKSVDRTFTAYLIIKNEDKTWEDIEAMQGNISDLLDEDCKKYKEIVKGDFEMAKRNVEKLEMNVKERAKQLIETGVKQKDAIDMLVYEFPNLSRTMAINGYKKAESEFKKSHEEAAKKVEEEKVNQVLSECDEEMAEYLTHIFDDEKETIKRTTKAENCVVKNNKITKKAEVKKEIKKEVKKEVAPDKAEPKKLTDKIVQTKDSTKTTIVGDTNNIAIPKEEAKLELGNTKVRVGYIKETHKPKSNLKILNWIKNVEGTNGIYVVSADGVKLQEKECTKDFKTLEDLEKYRQVELDKLNAYVDEVKEVFGMME